MSSSHNYYELLKMDMSGVEIPYGKGKVKLGISPRGAGNPD